MSAFTVVRDLLQGQPIGTLMVGRIGVAYVKVDGTDWKPFYGKGSKGMMYSNSALAEGLIKLEDQVWWLY